MNDQDLTAQKNALVALGASSEKTFTDQGLTGANRARPGLREALAACRDGDTLVVTKLDRLTGRCAMPRILLTNSPVAKSR
jgi:DNA invertase Pin-like site-specific DNA recombinase